VIDRDVQMNRAIVSPMVRIESNCTIEDTVLFNGVRVGRGARLRRVIVEEGVTIPPGVTIGHGNDEGYPKSPGGVVVIAPGHPFNPSETVDLDEQHSDARTKTLG
jgi:glucose-1-phosphate adenylyltransferase